MEARKSAASGAAGGLTYSEFYRLLAAVPTPVPFGTAAAAAITSVANGGAAAAPAATVEAAMEEFEADASAKMQGFRDVAIGGGDDGCGDAPPQQEQQQ